MERPHKHYRKQNLKKYWVNNIQSKQYVKSYYSYMHCYLQKQKHAIRLIFNEKKFMHAKRNILLDRAYYEPISIFRWNDHLVNYFPLMESMQIYCI